MDKLNCEQLQNYLDEIISSEAFELHMVSDERGTVSCYIPYMMNDALECYLVLMDGRMVGEYLMDYEGEISAKVTSHEGNHGVIVRQGSSNVFTVWFQECYRVLNCYRYDQIGHFWVKGQEHWRRLVYIIGTIHDKYHYMGETVCNDVEMQLAALMGFGPFRRYSPIRQSLDGYYEDTDEGFEVMNQLAKEAGDAGFLRLLKLYKRVPFRRWMTKLLADALNRWERVDLYQLIFQKVQEAAMEYPERIYQTEHHVENEREAVGRKLKMLGFTGEYPLFQRGTMQILAMEEHPFVVLEAEQYHYRIQFMVSESSVAEGKINEGFFQRRGNRGWIAPNLEFLD